MNQTHIHFITGKLAEPAVRTVVTSLSASVGFEFSIGVMPISVAALMTPQWLLRHWQIPACATRVILPGHLAKGLDQLREHASVEIECGPQDIRQLPSFFGQQHRVGDNYGQYRIEILAEINYAFRLTSQQLLQQSKQLSQDGADCIDLGCDPGQLWNDVADRVKLLTDAGLRVSIDTFDIWEAAQAVKAGASLVLSVNRSNREAACDWGAEVVVVPDDLDDFLPSLMETAEYLDQQGVPFRLDPILEPIGCGFSRSLNRYYQVRDKLPSVNMMMGIGNITELTDGDSASINTLLLGYCEELNIQSVLTTQVINWARSSVKECDLARRMVHYAVDEGIPPKNLEPRMIALRDPRLLYYSEDVIQQLASAIKDNNYRILIDQNEIHLLSCGVHLRGTDPFDIMHLLMQLPQSRNVDPGHAFYLGFELSKALTALTLGKNYEQDVALNWGMHTRPEKHHRLTKKRRTLDQ